MGASYYGLYEEGGVKHINYGALCIVSNANKLSSYIVSLPREAQRAHLQYHGFNYRDKNH